MRVKQAFQMNEEVRPVGHSGHYSFDVLDGRSTLLSYLFLLNAFG